MKVKGRVITSRGGRKPRRLHSECRAMAKKTYFCTECGNETLKRIRAGLWGCIKCKSQVCGNAYHVV